MIVVTPIQVQLLLILCAVLFLWEVYETLSERHHQAHKGHLPLEEQP